MELKGKNVSVCFLPLTSKWVRGDVELFLFQKSSFLKSLLLHDSLLCCVFSNSLHLCVQP